MTITSISQRIKNNVTLCQKVVWKSVTPRSANAAGFDLYAAEDTVVHKGDRALISTDLLREHTVIAPRSGNAVKHGINVGAGVIDADYAGHVKVLLFNHGSPFRVACGDRIAQLILEKIDTM